ncbi:DUF3438 family protein [Pseudomonas avellanae]|uniref:DUF3438 family protein n=1 Tax=Pseudomonas avellanae TaxID=46257 RepID=UPI003CC5F4B4
MTAVKLQNQAVQRIALDPRELMGEFTTAAFQHPYLGPRGDASDTTTLYLVTRGHGLTQATVLSAPQADPRAAKERSMKGNPLLKYLVIPFLLIVVFIGIKTLGGGPQDTGRQRSGSKADSRTGQSSRSGRRHAERHFADCGG